MIRLTIPAHNTKKLEPVRSYLVAYRDGGLEALEQFNSHPQSAALDDQP